MRDRRVQAAEWKRRVKEVNVKEWEEEAEEKSSLRWYRGEKSEFGTARYMHAYCNA